MISDDQRAPMLVHLEELRWRLVKAAASLVLGAIFAYLFRDQIFEWISRPYYEAFPESELVTIRPAESFSAAMRLALFGGFVLASVPITWQAWAFVSPGLTKKERKWVIPVVLTSVSLFLIGVAFAYYILPRGLTFLQETLDVGQETAVSEYLNFALRFLLVFGISFEFPIVLFMAGALGLVKSEQLARGRRWAVLVIAVVGAAATPTGDPFTMLFLSIPLYMLYEITLLAIRYILRK